MMYLDKDNRRAYILVGKETPLEATYPKWWTSDHDEEFCQNGDAIAIRLDLWITDGEATLKAALEAGLTYESWDQNMALIEDEN